MKNYLCKKCRTLVKCEYVPKNSACSAGGAHEWTYLAEEGKDSYLCKKCGTIVKCASIPNSAGCPQGGYHEWEKL